MFGGSTERFISGICYLFFFTVESCLCSRSGLCHVVHVCLRGFPVRSHEILNLGDFRLMAYRNRKQGRYLVINLSGTIDDLSILCV